MQRLRENGTSNAGEKRAVIYRGWLATASANMEKLYAQITEQARHEYTLAYVPRSTSPTAPYHKLEVRVNRPSVTIKTRQGYYAGPASTPASTPSDRR